MQELHAGDRDTLEAMLGGLYRSSDLAERAEQQRKAAFRGNSAIWGMQSRVQVCVNVIAPSEDPDFVDLAWVSGLVDFRRLRHETVWSIACARKFDDDGNPIDLGDIESLDPNFEGDDTAPLMGEFCSKPVPDIKLNFGTDGYLRFELSDGPIGNTAATTCIIGLLGRRFVRRTAITGNVLGEHIARLYTPAELLIHDMYVHSDLQNAMDPEIHLYGQLPISPKYPGGGREASKLPHHQDVQSLGSSTAGAVAPELHWYRKMIESVFERAKWDAREFRGFRFRLKYPPIPSVAVFRYPLADA